MDEFGNSTRPGGMARHLATLKLISRLLGHELHSQGGSQTITLSRDEVGEIQTSIDLFIEDLSRRQGGAPTLSSTQSPLVNTRN